ncbi:MAG TPA: hypothetical protein VH414_18720 [Lichenihabitans sp.]|nr:hypothetical protein [Lichenihabitans sp.]
MLRATLNPGRRERPRRSGRRAAMRSLTVLAALASWALVPERAAATDLLWGVNGHPLTSYPGVSLETQLDLVAQAGLKSYRIDVTNVDQVARLADIVAAAKSRGIQILPILIPPADLDKQSEAELYALGDSFARVFLTRLGRDVPVWELGNELEIYALLRPCEKRDDGSVYPCEWGIAGGVGELDYYGPRVAKIAALLRGLSDATHAVAPDVRRAIGSAGWGHLGIFGRLQKAGVTWDISVWHMFGQDPEWAFKSLAAMGHPIWVTEFNFPEGSSREGETKQAQGLVSAMDRLRLLAPVYHVEAAQIYELLDETYWAPSYEASMGLVRLVAAPGGGWIGGGRKAAFDAVADALASARE